MARLTREQILARKLGHDVVDLDDGGDVEVRGLSRAEAHTMSELPTSYERDLFMISTGLVDPAMSKDDVRKWFAADGSGYAERVANAITRLSGMGADQGKDATKSVPR